METVIYDGECRFCIEKVQSFKQADQHHELEFIPRQDAEAERRFPEIVGVPLDEGVIVIDEQRKLHVAADGIYHMAQHFPSLKWRLFTWMYRLPVFKQATQIGYRIIAANRRRLGKTCVDNVCSLTDAKR